MAIVVDCPCGKQLRAADSAAGKKGKCPGCGQVLRVPHPAGRAEPGPFVATPAETAGHPAAVPPVPVAPPAQANLASDPDDYGAYDLSPAAAPPRVTVPAARATASSTPPLPPTPHAARAPVATQVEDDDGPDLAALAAARPPRPVPLPPVPVPLPPLAAPAGASSGTASRFMYLVLLAAMIPLAVSTLAGKEAATVGDRIARTIEHHPEVRTATSEADLFNALPDHRIEGALHARDTKMHWGYAGLSGGLFFAATLFVLPRAASRPRHLLLIGLFTGTIGILLLLAVQWAAFATDGVWVKGRGVLTLLFYLVKFIGFSYRSALDDDTNLFLSLFGFTFGVGMCEEVCKALPAYWALKTGRLLGWRDACRWGFISGVGFGVSEGITYAGDTYNGIDGADAYVVRFVSCVALHAVWSAAAAITLFRRQNLIHEAGHWASELLNLVVVLIVPMVLHGLYDTLLKKEHEALALLTAVVSFAWLAWNIEWARKGEDGTVGVSAATA